MVTRRGRTVVLISQLAVMAGLGLVAGPAAGEDRSAPPDPRPARDADPRPTQGGGRGGPGAYSIAQAVSDQAQLHTIAFNGLAFLTGDFGASTFLPPGKVCDFFGFQYMRDIDAAGKGHNPMFLNRVAGNVLQTLTAEQRRLLADLASEQAPRLRELALQRLPLIKAFHRELEGARPAGSAGLDKEAVKQCVAGIFGLDAELSYRRAEVFGRVAASLTPQQKASLARMKFGDFSTWPEADVGPYRLPAGTDKLLNVAYMTYASEFFSWYAGSAAADTYFCPERHGTYFGGFYMKDMPAMGKRDYDISTSVTGDSGRDFLNALTPEQRGRITAIADLQRQALAEMVEVRRAIATELRQFLAGAQADREKVLALGRRYGELDGEVSYLYATAFAKVRQSLTPEQQASLRKLRGLEGYTSAPAYIYSSPLKEAPPIADSDHLFFPPQPGAGGAR